MALVPQRVLCSNRDASGLGPNHDILTLHPLDLGWRPEAWPLGAQEPTQVKGTPREPSGNMHIDQLFWTNLPPGGCELS